MHSEASEWKVGGVTGGVQAMETEWGTQKALLKVLMNAGGDKDQFGVVFRNLFMCHLQTYSYINNNLTQHICQYKCLYICIYICNTKQYTKHVA